MIGMVLFVVLMSTELTSCNNEEPTLYEQEEKYITVGLGCTGDILDITSSPLGRATEADMYEIQVYSLEEVDGKTRNNPYAHGEFNTLDGITIRLLEDQNYKFVIGITIGYGKKFNNTEFIYSTSYDCQPSNISISFEGFYGELAQYTPKEGNKVNIETKRVSYGANFIAEGLTEGILNISITTENNKSHSIELTPDNPQNYNVYTFSNAHKAWYGIENKIEDPTTGLPTITYEDYHCEKSITVNWTKADGTVTPLGMYNVLFKRNTKTTIRIKVTDTSISNGLTIIKEETPITDDENEYLIEGGSIIEIPLSENSN